MFSSPAGGTRRGLRKNHAMKAAKTKHSASHAVATHGNPQTGHSTHPPPIPSANGTRISGHPLRMMASFSRLSFSYISKPSFSQQGTSAQLLL